MFLVVCIIMLTVYVCEGHVVVEENHPTRGHLVSSVSAFINHTVNSANSTKNNSYTQIFMHRVRLDGSRQNLSSPSNGRKNARGQRQALAEAPHEKRPRHDASRKGKSRHARKGSRNGTTRQKETATKGGKRANFRCCRQVQLTNLSAPRKRKINPFPERDGSSNESSDRTHAPARNSTTKTVARKCVDCRRALLSTTDDGDDDNIEIKNFAFENSTNSTTDSSIFVAATTYFEVISVPQTETYSQTKTDYVSTSQDNEKFTNSSYIFTNNSFSESIDDELDESTCSNCSNVNRTAPVVILTEADTILTDAPDIWNQEKYLTKGINPNIEVSIEILHRDRDIEANQTAQAEENLLASVLDQMIRVNSEFPALGKPAGGNISTQTTQMPSSESQIIDMCHHWMQCPGEHKLLSLARLDTLPTCPCQYSFSVHYNEQIWDERQNRYFRWRDASGPHDKLQVYQPGARWCIRSLVSETSTSLAAQHCCYDNDRCLITRGAGAGTPNFVSPEVSRDLHYRVDVLPWIVCKGDWSRYHERRPPNNVNECPENPSDTEYAKQAAAAKEF